VTHLATGLPQVISEKTSEIGVGADHLESVFNAKLAKQRVSFADMIVSGRSQTGRKLGRAAAF